ncbi:9637_t:CDS:2 [Ambispora leptoticha]|uniref:9637_t:CDS:1 n=1 Tax=Ambispora leptoticha TaxID=144679 RepID=A0A9N8VKC6_9GLOM|nr:9637_t:CDS:2 [Ambispora leptoticha]
MISIKSFATLFVILFVTTNYTFADQMLDLVNQARQANNVPPLKLDSRLVSAAQKHSNYQASINTMTHDDASGPLGTRLSNEGVDWSAAAENVAWNQPNITEVMKAWLNSPGHRENLLNSAYTIFGWGVKNLYWTQDFAALMSAQETSHTKENEEIK